MDKKGIELSFNTIAVAVIVLVVIAVVLFTFTTLFGKQRAIIADRIECINDPNAPGCQNEESSDTPTTIAFFLPPFSILGNFFSRKRT